MSGSERRRGRCLMALAMLLGPAAMLANVAAASELPSMYVMDFLATAAVDADMNDRGTVIGRRWVDNGCGSSCMPPTEEAVWIGTIRRPLPLPPGDPTVYLRGINRGNWLVATVYSGPDGRAVVWKPRLGPSWSYEIVDLGAVPGLESSEAVGIDDLNRVIGYSPRPFPEADVPFMWSPAEGFIDLTTLGFPSDHPRAISPGGTVAFLYGWYQVDVPGVVHENAPAPPGRRGPGYYVAINDAGDQVRFLGPTSGHNLNYLHRYYHEGAWQELWPIGGTDSSPFGIGSITGGLDITATIGAGGLRAEGPAGLAEDLTPMLSPAYGDANVTEAGRMTEDGRMMLAQVSIGRAQRLVRLVEGVACAADCVRIGEILLDARFVHDPEDPFHCTENAATAAEVEIRAVDEAGAPLPGAHVAGFFLDNYWLEGLAKGTTDGQGIVRFSHRGPPCVGAISFLVTSATQRGRSFDRTTGVLQQWMIPTVPPP